MPDQKNSEMKRYSVSIVQVKGDTADLTHIQLYGRSEYEAIGYAMVHRVCKSGKILAINAFNCDNEPSLSNLEALLKEEQTN